MSQDNSENLSKLNLNPKATEWKPNFGAKSFVPTFGAPAAAPAAAPPAAAAAPGKFCFHIHRVLFYHAAVLIY
jgi:peptide chain release factor subunit 3